MKTLFFNPSSIITVDTEGKNYKSGTEQNELYPISGHSIICEDGIIADILPTDKIDKSLFDRDYDLSGKTVLPGFIDCHTHTVFAGSRADEFRRKIAGADYEEIAREGGGIMSTVRAVRASTKDDLVKIAQPRIESFIEQGITTLEIKSGYGLSFDDEVKILEAIKELNTLYPVDITATFLGAHTIPAEYADNRDDFIDLIINKMLPYIAEHKLADYCDAFCEATAFTANEVDKIFTKASSLGLNLKLHTEQFNNIGGLKVAAKHKCSSVDHLEVFDKSNLQLLKESGMTAVLLPGVSFFLNYGYAPGRDLIDNNIPVALSTDFNPGSSHISNISMIMGIAALKMKLTIEEIISAFTINAAKAIKREKFTGSIEKGKQADFAIINSENYSDLVYHTGENLNVMTVKDGQVIYNR